MRGYCEFFLKNLLLAICLLVIVSSCKKKDSSVGIGTLDENEILNGITVDTFDLIT
jgi:hypothetical protein